MGRRPSIDREQVLAIADNIVADRGAAALTIDAVAKAAGISKGGVQSCFGTKEAMISALLDRWVSDYAGDLRAALGGVREVSPDARIAAHVAISLDENADSSARSSALVAGLIQTPEHLGSVQSWYAERFAGLFEGGSSARALRIALLATEGAVLLRHFGLARLDGEQWEILRADIEALVDGTAEGLILDGCKSGMVWKAGR